MIGVFPKTDQSLWSLSSSIEDSYRNARDAASGWSSDSEVEESDEDDDCNVGQAGQGYEAGNQPLPAFAQGHYPQPGNDQVDQLQMCAAIKCIDHGVGSYPVKVLAGILGGLAVALFLSGVGTLPVIALALTAGLVFLVSTAVSAAGKEADESLLLHLLKSVGWAALGAGAVALMIVLRGGLEGTHWNTIMACFQ